MNVLIGIFGPWVWAISWRLKTSRGQVYRHRVIGSHYIAMTVRKQLKAHDWYLIVWRYNGSRRRDLRSSSHCWCHGQCCSTPQHCNSCRKLKIDCPVTSIYWTCFLARDPAPMINTPLLNTYHGIYSRLYFQICLILKHVKLQTPCMSSLKLIHSFRIYRIWVQNLSSNPDRWRIYVWHLLFLMSHWQKAFDPCWIFTFSYT